MRKAGADVIDLGCLPDTPFPHLEESVRALKAAGPSRSASIPPIRRELSRGAKAGADFLLSLDETTLDIAEGLGRDADPRAAAAWRSRLARPRGRGRQAARPRLLVDPILDPIHFGFAASLARYVETRRRLPEAEMMMGTGNLTELTEADSGGITAMLLGLCSELRHSTMCSRCR